MHEAIALVRRFWTSMEARQWEAATACLAPELEIRWPHTGEVFRGREGFMAMNRAYPGDWHIEIVRVQALEPPEVLSIIVVRDGDQAFHAVSLLQVEGGLIRSGTEYWTAPETPPDWRLDAGWSEIDRHPAISS